MRTRKPAATTRKRRARVAKSQLLDDDSVSTRRVRNVRDTVDIASLVPNDALEEQREELANILERIDTGYWPSLHVQRGWYDVLITLNQALAVESVNYKITSISSTNGQLNFAIRVPDSDTPKLSTIMAIVQHATARSRLVCEKCGTLKTGRIPKSLELSSLCVACAQAGKKAPRKRRAQHELDDDNNEDS